MVAAPPAVEGWRERYCLAGSWARTLRDLSLAPFFGNSIASRLPQPAGAAAGPPETLLLGGFRAAQRVCVELAASERGWDAESSGSGSNSSEEFQALARGARLGGFGGDGGSSSSGGGSEGGEGGGGGDDEPLLVWLVNTHLDHASPETREAQAKVRGCALCLLGGGGAGVGVGPVSLLHIETIQPSCPLALEYNP